VLARAWGFDSLRPHRFADISGYPPNPRASSSAGGSAGLQNRRSQVRVLDPPPSVRSTCEHVFAMWHPPDPWSYSYLLGMYLGDGCVSASRRTYQLVVVCDASYPGIIEDCAAAMMLTLLPRRVGRNPHRVDRCVRVIGTSKRWPEAFPQHGPGRKHERRIELAAWQREIVDRFPQEFLRGRCTRTAAGRSTGSRPHCPAGGWRSTRIRGGSSRTGRLTSAACSATTASGSGSAGRSRTRGTSRCPTGGASRSWIRSCQ
jgi:hypothetical protein